MSGAYAIKSNPEKTTIYDLSGPYGRGMSPEELALRRAELRLVCARVDPESWDAKRFAESGTNVEVAWSKMLGWRQILKASSE